MSIGSMPDKAAETRPAPARLATYIGNIPAIAMKPQRLACTLLHRPSSRFDR